MEKTDSAGDFNLMSAEDIRGDSNIYQRMIIFCLNRLHEQTYKSTLNNNWKEVRALEASIRMLHAYVAPYYGEDYNGEIKKIEKKLEELGELEVSMKKIKVYQKWVEAIVKRFGEFQILPPIKVAWKAGEGMVKPGEEL